MNFVKTILDQIEPLDESRWNLVKGHLSFKKIPRGMNFVSIGDPVTHFAFVKLGLFKSVSLNAKNGKEVIKSFCGPGDLLGAYADFLRSTPSRVMITALSDAEICIISIHDINKLMEKSSFWEIYRRKIAESRYLLKEDKEHELSVNSADERFETFQGRFAHLEHHLPAYLVAGYLNITPSYLSTLKARRSKLKKRHILVAGRTHEETLSIFNYS